MKFIYALRSYQTVYEGRCAVKKGVASAFPPGAPLRRGGVLSPTAPAEGVRRRRDVGPRSSLVPRARPHISRLRRKLCCWPAAKRGACGGRKRYLNVAAYAYRQPGE